MSINTVLDTKNYMDMQGIANLKGQSISDPQLAKHEVSQQFESILVQMLIKSMREANKALIDNKEMDSSNEMYQDLFDKQVSLSLSGAGLGFGKTIENYLNQSEINQSDIAKELAALQPETLPTSTMLSANALPSLATKKEKPTFNNELHFVSQLLGYAKKAAESLGVDPKLLLAQAALETGWGKNVLANETTGASFNLFNIKADAHWGDNKAVEVPTLEEKDGLIFKEKSAFRAYDSYAESFKDYVHFIKNNPRYQEALKESGNPEKYMHLLQQAHYATDSEYSNKVMEIYHGTRLNQLVEQAEFI